MPIRVVREGLWIVLGQVVSGAGLLVGTRLLTDLAEPSDFGLASLLLGGVALVYGTTCGPLMQAVLRLYPEAERESATEKLHRVAHTLLRQRVRWAGSGLLVLTIVVAAMRPEALAAGLVAVGLLALEAARGIATTLLNAARRQRAFSIWIATEAWARPLAAVGLVLAVGSSAVTLLSGYLLGTGVVFLMLSRAVPGSRWEGVDQGRSSDDMLRRQMVRYGLPLVPIALVAWTSGLADRYLLGALIGIQATGVYAATYGVISRPFLMVGGAVELVLRQPYYEAVSRGDSSRERAILAVWMTTTVVLCLAGLICVLLWNDLIASLVLGESFRAGASLMPWIAAGYLLLAAAQVLERVCYAHRRTRLVLGVQSIGAALCIAIAWPAIATFGMAGAAIAVPVYFGGQLASAAMAAWICMSASGRHRARGDKDAAR